MTNYDDSPLEFPEGRNEVIVKKTRSNSDDLKFKLNRKGKASVSIPTDSERFNLEVSITLELELIRSPCERRSSIKLKNQNLVRSLTRCTVLY